jgi:chromosomal replication initiator protein
MVAVYLAKKLTRLSFPKIGRQFGGRDHTTIMHSVNKITALIAKDAELAATIALLTAEIQKGMEQ